MGLGIGIGMAVGLGAVGGVQDGNGVAAGVGGGGGEGWGAVPDCGVCLSVGCAVYQGEQVQGLRVWR